MKVGDATLIPMVVTIDGKDEIKVWQKSVITSYRVATGVVTTYVDELGAAVDLPDVYEMTPVEVAE